MCYKQGSSITMMPNLSPLMGAHKKRVMRTVQVALNRVLQKICWKCPLCLSLSSWQPSSSSVLESSPLSSAPSWMASLLQNSSWVTKHWLYSFYFILTGGKQQCWFNVCLESKLWEWDQIFLSVSGHFLEWGLSLSIYISIYKKFRFRHQVLLVCNVKIRSQMWPNSGLTRILKPI